MSTHASPDVREVDRGVHRRRIRELEFMVPEFVDRTCDSKCVQAPPACPSRQRRPSIRREACGFEDLGRFNLWRPMVVARLGGSKWLRALPGGGRWSSLDPAVASGSGPSPAQNSGTRIYGSRIRRSTRRQQPAVGPADRQQPAVGPADRQQVAVGPSDPAGRKNASGREIV